MNFVFENISGFKNFIECPDVNSSGIPRFAYSPILSAANVIYSDNKISNPIRQMELNDNVTNYIISACVNHSPDDWTGYYPKVKSLFSYLNKKYLRDLQTKRALLMLDQSLEGYQTNWLWGFFHNECRKYSISPTCIVYVTGNLIANDIYNKWADSMGLNERIKVIPYVHFEMDIAMSARVEKLPTFEDHMDYKSKNQIKTFACLNKRIRPHRVWFFQYLCKSDLISKGLVSMNKFDKHSWNWEGNSMKLETVDKISDILPLEVYGTPNNQLDDQYYIGRFNDRVCLDTYVSVISEAHCGDSDETLFISEKTFKPIACKHPFMIMGNKDSLNKMRELGYRTFDGFIDESYDKLPTHERMSSIIKSINKINNIPNKLEWFKSMEEIIEYNYTILLNKITTPPSSFVELTRYYENFFNVDNISKKLI